MPINGFVVAVHISLIKTVTKLDDTIRFQFHVPGKAKLSLPANAIAEEQPNTVFIKVMTKVKKSKTPEKKNCFTGGCVSLGELECAGQH